MKVKSESEVDSKVSGGQDWGQWRDFRDSDVIWKLMLSFSWLFPRLNSGTSLWLRLITGTQPACPALIGGVIIGDDHCNNYSEFGDTVVLGTYFSDPCIHMPSLERKIRSRTHA